ncbi:MAG TPA: hypothetical protein VIF34_16075 [Methylocystis sp.]|jgi:hypothetical protein
MARGEKNVVKPDIQHPDILESVARIGFHRIILRARSFSVAFLKAKVEVSDTTTTIERCEHKNAGQ